MTARRQREGGAGSGFIISKSGHAITNSHVVNGRQHLLAITDDGDRIEAQVIGDDPATDIAILKLAARDLPMVELGDSNGLRVGQLVIAMGIPLGLHSTVSTGVVSASPEVRRFASSRAEELDAPLGSNSTARRIWLLTPGRQTVVEVGSERCANWSEGEKPVIVAYRPLPSLSVARIGHDGASLNIAGVEASPAIHSGELPPQVRVASLAGGKEHLIKVNGTLTIADQEHQSVASLIHSDKRFFIVNTKYG